MTNYGSGLPAEWPFRSQNAIEASDSIAIARWPVGKVSDNARIMLSSLFRYSLV